MARREFLAHASTGLLVGGGLTLAQTFTASSASAASALPLGPKPDGKLPSPLELPRISESETQTTKMPSMIPPEGRVGFAIVGLGRLSLEEILPAFGESKRAKPVALVSSDRAKALKVAKIYGIPESGIYSYETYDQIRDNPAIHAVYIVLPNSMHAEFTVRAARAGKHVLCEKPMANSVAECEQMIAECRKAKRRLMVAYRIQYEPRNRTVMEWVRGKKVLGEIRLLDLANAQNQSTKETGQWRQKKALAGGGSLPDIGLYCSNTARFLTGEEPYEVGAMIQTDPKDPRFREVEDTVTWWMKFPSGILAHCLTSYSAVDTKRYRVIGTKGYAEMDPGFSYHGLRLRRSHTEEVTPGQKVVVEESVQIPEKNQFALELDHFADCVANDRDPYTPGEEGLQDQRVIDAIYEAARTQRPVRLPKIEKLDAFRGTAPSP